MSEHHHNHIGLQPGKRVQGTALLAILVASVMIVMKGFAWLLTGSVALLGSFLDDGAEAGTWLADGLQPSIYTYASYAETGGFSVGGYRAFQGSLGGMGEGGQIALDTDYLVVATTSLGIPCADEPAGALTVRTADGGWWTITFDMQPETFEMTGECDGCGRVTDGAGAEVGTVCADFSALLSD